MSIKKSRLSPAEMLSLLALLIKERTKEGEDDLRQYISKEPDWKFIVELSKKEGVLHPFFLSAPEPVRHLVREPYYHYAAQGAHDLRCIQDIFSALDKAGVPALILKGLSVDSDIYKDGFYRPRSDVDIVIEEKDHGLFRKVISGLDYSAYAEGKRHGCLESRVSFVYVNQDRNKVPIHLHNHVINNMYLLVGGFPKIPLDAFWRETVLFKPYGFIRAFAVEMQLVYLCEHALKHAYEELVFLYEIDRFIRSAQSLDWQKVEGLAMEFGFKTFVYYTLFFAARMFSTPIPLGVLERLKPDKVSLGERIFIKDILSYHRRKYASYIVYLFVQAGLMAKALYLYRTVFNRRISR